MECMECMDLIMFSPYDQVCFQPASDGTVHADYLKGRYMHSVILWKCWVIAFFCEGAYFVVLAAFYSDKVGVSRHQRREIQSQTCNINVNAIARSIGERLFSALPGIHAVTGRVR